MIQKRSSNRKYSVFNIKMNGFIQGVSQKFPDKLKIKKTKNFFGKVDLFHSIYSPSDSIHGFSRSRSELKDIFISSVEIMLRMAVVDI